MLASLLTPKGKQFVQGGCITIQPEHVQNFSKDII